jgi:uncharacterized protein (UPF0297 family)
MKCAIVSLITQGDPNNIPKENIDLLVDILNGAADENLILFPGWTISSKSKLDQLIKKIKNRKTTFVLEVGSGYHEKNDPETGFYVIKGKKIIAGGIKQLFADSDEANENKDDLLQKFLDALKTKRKFEIRNKIVRLVICGENNFLVNRQNDSKEVNRVEFRDSKLSVQFKSVVENTDIFLNPAHTPMGNLGKLTKRWAYLSKAHRACLFTTNECVEKNKKSKSKKGQPDLDKRYLQYIFINNKEKTGEEKVHDKYKITKFSI